MSKSNSYNQIVKATGLFGGVQIINIIISIIRSKFVAVLLGTSGVGITGLLSGTTGLIASITNLQLSFSAVRTISSATATDNQTLISRTIITLRRWVNFTGILGGLVTLILAPQLSQWTFGNSEYRWAFMWLSVTLFFQALSGGQLALLQGLRKLKQLAKANVTGSVIGTIVSLILYYRFGIKGIVPSLISISAISLILSWYFTRKVEVEKVDITYKESFYGGLDMVKLGSVTMLNGFMVNGVSYLIRIFISNTGGVEQVGLYVASWTIINTYVGMVFNAMSTDYFPRLSAVNKDNAEIRKLVNQQAEIAILILGPILILLLSALPLVIRILLTTKFLPISGLIQYALLGVFLKAASWTLGYILLAKGDIKYFLLSEVVANVIMIISNIVLYHFFKLNGIGIAFLITYTLYFLLVLFIVHKKYDFSFTSEFVKLLIVHFGLYVAALLVAIFYGFPYAYISGAILLIVSAVFSFLEMRKRIDLNLVLDKIRRK